LKFGSLIDELLGHELREQVIENNVEHPVIDIDIFVYWFVEAALSEGLKIICSESVIFQNFVLEFLVNSDNFTEETSSEENGDVVVTIANSTQEEETGVVLPIDELGQVPQSVSLENLTFAVVVAGANIVKNVKQVLN
jgi:hypothetical protein